MQKILVTGGAGFVGQKLVNKLVKENIEVIVLDNLSSGTKDNINKNATFIKGDIRDNKLVDSIIKECSLIFHLAAEIELQKSIDDPINCFEINVVGTLNIIKAAIKYNIQRFVFASSSAVYPLNCEKALTEEMAINGETPYGISKLTGEQMLAYYLKKNNLNYCALRCFNIYGPGQKIDSAYSAVIPKFIKLAKNGEDLPLYNGGIQTRDFIHVDDVVEAYILMSKSNRTGSFNLGSGNDISIKEIAIKISNVEKKSCLKELPKKTGDALKSLANISKIKKVIAFTPSISFDDAVKSLYKSYW